MNRAAVIIGVRSAGDLPELKAALDGVQAVGAWAKAQGFKPVVKITDEKRPVSAKKIKDAIRKLVDTDSYDQLFVYFAGHGVNLQTNEYWLLSGAPEDTQEAVNVAGSVKLAKSSGIPHVVFVSDACRTAAEGIRAQGIRGSEIFPNQARPGPHKAVDVFYASLLGEPALEIQDKDAAAARYVSVYTDELVAALRGERRNILTPDATDLTRIYLRPHALKRHLTSEVPRLVAARLGPAATHSQTPDADVLSDEFAFLQMFDAANFPLALESVVGGAVGMAPRSPRLEAAPRPTLATVAADALQQALHAPEGVGGRVVENALRNTIAGAGRFSDAVTREREEYGAMHYETGCGFKVRGAVIGAVSGAPGVVVEQIAPHLARVRIDAMRATTVLIELDDGRCVVLPAIRDFIAALTFENGGLSNVSYEPSDRSDRWPEYVKKREELTALRALIGESVKMGVFRLESADAPKLTDKIRVMKGLDPTMALYAAYSYDRLSRRDLIRDMESFVVSDLGMSFFDLALLADRDPGDRDPSRVLPFVPVLAQGWALLGAFNAWTPLLKKLRPHVTSSLWTVFDKEALPLLRDAMKGQS